jgi:multimeric flavodoxin WrbA
MKVCLVNGSPHAAGCTYTALSEVASALHEDGVETEVFQLGTEAIAGCKDCGYCSKHGKCVTNDKVNEFVGRLKDFDGFVFGSPVHFAGADGAITSFLNRVFFVAPPELLRLKPGAAVVSARRAGTTASFDQLNKYFTIAEMPVISSCYWNMVHGFTPDDVRQDKEGLRIMRVLGHNMAWFLKCKAAAQKAGVALPKDEPPARTNFIR